MPEHPPRGNAITNSTASRNPAVLGRFAPSPSGRMHLGNVFTVLLAWLAARSQGGRLLLRIEDLDPARSKPDYIRLLADDLHWLGLDYDEGPPPLPAGQAPATLPQAEAYYYQSRRGNFYAGQIARLEAHGLVYPCFCSRAELHAANAPHPPHAATTLPNATPLSAGRAQAAQASTPTGGTAALATGHITPLPDDGSYIYNRRCLALSGAQRDEKTRQRAAAGLLPALRACVPDETIVFEDLLQGPCSQNLAVACGDFILRRSDGVYAYQLAASADDGAMGITQVVRGRDLLTSTPRQIWLLRQLGYTPPQYAHVPLLLAPDGRRLSKRDADLDLGALRQSLPGPQPLLGALAHLAGLLNAPRAVTAQALIPLFDWGKLHRHDLVVDEVFLQMLHHL